MWTAFWTVSALASSAGLGVLMARVSLGLVLRAVDVAAGRGRQGSGAGPAGAGRADAGG